jgi:alpha-2-macroglobulin
LPTRVHNVVFCASALVTLASGCRKPDAAHVVQVTPHGEISGDLRAGVRISFDRPVVPGSALGATLLPPPVVLSPGVPGTTVWLDQQTLVFTPAQKLQPSTRYRVALQPAALGKTLVAVEAGAGESFVYARLHVRNVVFPAPGPQFQGRAPVVRVDFSQPVDPNQVAKGCRFVADRGKKIDARVATSATAGAEASDSDAPESGSGTLVRLAPVEKLEPGAGYKLYCRAGLLPLVGGEGLAEDLESAFQTYGPLRVVKVSPEGHDVVPDDAVVKVEFSTPVDPEQVRRYVKLDTGRDQSQVQPSFEANGLRTLHSWKGNLEPSTWYNLEIAGQITDVFGQKLGADERHAFQAGDAGPRLRVERGIYAVERSSGRYAVWTRNLHGFGVTCARVPEAKLATLLAGPVNFDSWYGSEDKPVDYRELGVRPARLRIKTTGSVKNKWHDDSLVLASVCAGAPQSVPVGQAAAVEEPAVPESDAPAVAAQAGPAPAGVYLLELDSRELKPEARERPRRVLANVTDLGLLAKVGDAASLVWVVRLSDGQPVAGATVRIRDIKGQVRFSGTSNADGIVMAPGVAKLLPMVPKAPQGDGDDHNEAYEEWDSRGERRMIVTAQTGDDLAVLDTNWSSGLQVWNFGVNEEHGGGDLRVRGFLQSDRGLYRPGDTVHLRGLVRAIDLAGKMRVPAKAKKVHLVIEDPRGTTLVEEDVPASAFGGFHRDLELDPEARLGDYRVKGSVLGQSFADKFSVEEYRPRSFEVKLTTGKKHLFFGQKISFKVEADYLYGAPLRQGKLKWGIRRRAHTPSFPEFELYSFQDLVALWDEGAYWARDEERSFSSFVQDGESELDDKGRAQASARDDDQKLAGPQDYLIEATVTDSRGEAVTARQALVMHQAALYLGLHSEEFVQKADAPFAVSAVALTPEGKRRAAQGVKLTITRSRWDCTGLGRCERKTEAPVVARTIDIPETGAAVERVTLSQPGSYNVKLEAGDGRGGQAIASDSLYVVGKGEAFWSGDEGARMTLVSSRPKYKSGDVAKLVAQANLPGALALVTLERDGVMQHQVKRLETSGEAIEVPVEARFAPNVYAAVTLVRGRVGEGEKGKPQFKMGMVNLQVDSSDRRLEVTVDTDRPSYRPGETVSATVKVRNGQGAPVKAELALAAADEGVLQIAGYKTPDPLPIFYRPWGLGVNSSTTWNRIAAARDPSHSSDEEGEGGDAGGAEGGRVRSRFMATAYWNPALVTAADGTAHVSFTAPDNLTAFRVMAVAADKGERFGSGDKRFTVNKPLQAMPALPRFLTLGDALNATVVVHNNSNQPAKVTVSATVTGGVHLQGDTSQIIDVPASGAASAGFPAVAEAEGEASITFQALGGGEADAVLTKVPVERPSTSETTLVGEGSTAKHAEHSLPKIAGVLPGRSRLEVVLDTTGLSRLDESLSYLVGYPYGCLEQTTSKVVPMVAVGDLAASLDLPEVNQAKLKRFVSTGIAKILRHQHEDGGFGLWIGAPTEEHYTAFGLWGLAVARRSGWEVDKAALDKGAHWLRNSLARSKNEDGYHYMGVAGAQAFALYVLAELAGDKIGPGADAALLSKLVSERSKLPRYGRAFVARALARMDRKDEAKKVLDEILAEAGAGQGPLVIGENHDTDLSWYWSSDTRTSAIVLGALIEADPKHPAIERLSDGLLAARNQGRWENTQENLYSLVALADLARVRAASGGATITVTAGGQSLYAGALKGAEVKRFAVPSDGLGAGKLIIETQGAPVYYMARLHSVRVLDPAARQAGLTVVREYLDGDSGRPLSQAKLGQLVKVRLKIESPSSRSHVAVVDRLPAGLEPVLARFKATDEEGGDEQPVHWWWMARQTRWQNQQLHDDRVELFADVLVAGETTHEYLTRAMSAGTFTAPGTLVEMMYKPTVNGRSEGGKLQVVR